MEIMETLSPSSRWVSWGVPDGSDGRLLPAAPLHPRRQEERATGQQVRRSVRSVILLSEDFRVAILTTQQCCHIDKPAVLPYFQVDIIAYIIPGLLHKTDGTLSREHRRQLFMLKAKTEEDERKTRALLFEQHYNKCAYLRYVLILQSF